MSSIWDNELALDYVTLLLVFDVSSRYEQLIISILNKNYLDAEVISRNPNRQYMAVSKLAQGRRNDEFRKRSNFAMSWGIICQRSCLAQISVNGRQTYFHP
jgi:hypothetical protein